MRNHVPIPGLAKKMQEEEAAKATEFKTTRAARAWLVAQGFDFSELSDEEREQFQDALEEVLACDGAIAVGVLEEWLAGVSGESQPRMNTDEH